MINPNIVVKIKTNPIDKIPANYEVIPQHSLNFGWHARHLVNNSDYNAQLLFTDIPGVESIETANRNVTRETIKV